MIKVGIFIGGRSREREVSFAGGRTVYDNLDKRIFEAIPIFVDTYGNLTRLNWAYIYRGTIRDFYPPVAFLKPSPNNFQVYAESLNLNEADKKDSLELIGEPLALEELKEIIDVAFLALHGAGGEDGSIQGVLEWLGIPYTGSGILPSALGMNKGIQKEFQSSVFEVPDFIRILRKDWEQGNKDFFEIVKTQIGFPLVIKPANQGSSIGVSVLNNANKDEFEKAIALAFFQIKLLATEWEKSDKILKIRQISDIRDGLGMPLLINGELVYHPENLLHKLNEHLSNNESVILEAALSESEVLIERFIAGKEFSCIVISDENGFPIALPPTEIVKGKELFDYKSKYLPGLSRKVTPIQISDEDINRIRKSCESLYNFFQFDVYARIDGFFDESGRIFLNDPNTTSGMMPSSFFFHQAAEIGLNPSQFLTFILRNSLNARKHLGNSDQLLIKLDHALSDLREHEDNRIKVAVIMGGYSTERHISIESGRNIYEKLSSSDKYRPIPIFLTGSAEHHDLFTLPVNILLKDNADDISYKLRHFERSEILHEIVEQCSEITDKYAPNMMGFEPIHLKYDQLPEMCDMVFIALHGRPGEDGAIQKNLEKLGLPYNGSGIESSQITINKFETNKILRQNGVLVADGLMVYQSEWEKAHSKVIEDIEKMGYPLIAKPADEGCSSAVSKVKNINTLNAYAELTFRKNDEKDSELCRILNISEKDEFPKRDNFLVEKFIEKGNARHFLEVTGGMLTYYDDKGSLAYEVFEASEALAEGEILSLAEKFLAGEGQNITPARYDVNPEIAAKISNHVKKEFEKVARLLNVQGYCRIDAFVRIFDDLRVEVVIIEINSLPGMTPATCIYHQAAIDGYKPYEFIDKILSFGQKRSYLTNNFK